MLSKDTLVADKQRPQKEEAYIETRECKTSKD